MALATEDKNSGGTNRPIESDVVNTQDTNVKDYSHKSTYGYIMRNGNRKARRHALSQIKKRK